MVATNITCSWMKIKFSLFFFQLEDNMGSSFIVIFFAISAGPKSLLRNLLQLFLESLEYCK